MPAGRPSKYKKEYAEQAYKYCLMGADDSRLAELFEVAESTLNGWKIEHPEFMESIKKGKQIADAEVAHSLYNRGKGFTAPEVEVFQYQGNPIIVPVEKYYPPDTGAAMAWLKNRQPDKWRDRQDHLITVDTQANQTHDIPTLIEDAARLEAKKTASITGQSEDELFDKYLEFYRQKYQFSDPKKVAIAASYRVIEDE